MNHVNVHIGRKKMVSRRSHWSFTQSGADGIFFCGNLRHFSANIRENPFPMLR